MKKFVSRIRETKGLGKRLASLFLVLALVAGSLQTVPGIFMKAQAAEGDINITVHFQNDWGWTTPSLQYWGGDATVTGATGSQEVSGWGGAVGQIMTNEGNGFYSLTLTGNFTGFQFLDMAESANGSHNCVAAFVDEMKTLTGDVPTDLYFINTDSDGDGKRDVMVWYKDAAGSETLIASATPAEPTEPKEYNITIHFNNTGDWEKVCAYVGEDGFKTITGYEEYINNWQGKEISANAENEGWYDLIVTKQNATKLDFIFNNGSGGDGNQTSDLVATISSTTMELWVENENVSETKPEGWNLTAPAPVVTLDSIKVSDRVQIKIGDSLTDMKLYMNGVLECKKNLLPADYEASVVINGNDTGAKTTFTVGTPQDVYFRIQGGVLKNSISEKFIHTAAFTGNFWGLNFVDEAGNPYTIASWTPSDANAELTYLGGGIFARTFYFTELSADVTLNDAGYKVAFDDDWAYSVGSTGINGNNVPLTVKKGATKLTVLVDEVNGKLYDSVNTAPMSIAQNGGVDYEFPALTTVSFIGDARCAGDDNWAPAVKGYEFTQLSDTLYVYQKLFAAGTYNYKAVFNYEKWYEAEANNRSLNITANDTNVIVVYDTVSKKLYDNINNASEVAQFLGLEAAPAQAQVVTNKNATTHFTMVSDAKKDVKLVYGDKVAVESDVNALTTVTLKETSDGVYESEDIFFGDEAQDIVYYYLIAGNRTLDGAATVVSINGEDYSNYTREAFSGRTVTVPGTFPGTENTWDAASNEMTYQGNGLYQFTFKDVPAANYEYKIAFTSWTENYGVGGIQDGSNYGVTVPDERDVTVYYNDFSHLSVNSVDYVFANVTLAGTNIPSGTKLTDNDLTGIYTVTLDLPAGSYTDLVITCDGKSYPVDIFELETAKTVTFFFDPVTEIYYNNASDSVVSTGSIYYNTQDTSFKSVYGAVEQGEEVTFSINTGDDATSVRMIVKGSNKETLSLERAEGAANGVQKWSITTIFDQMGQNTYYFIISNGSSITLYGDDDGYYGAGTVADLSTIKPYDLIVYKAGFETPDWMKDAVIYQIFPDRFFNGDESNDFAQTEARGDVDYEYVPDWYALPENPEQEGLLSQDVYELAGAFYGDGNWSNEIYGGDLEGITEKIDYLKALGVNVIYLNPVFASISSHRYDTSDYKQIDPVLGNLGDFEELTKIAEENDMHVVLDGVFNHVSDDSIYFDRYYSYLNAGTDTVGAYPYWACVYDYMAEKGADIETAKAYAKDYFSENYGITNFAYTEWFDVFCNSYLKDDTGVNVCDTTGNRAGLPVYGYDGWWGYDSMPVIKSTNGSEYQTGNWAEEIIGNEDGTSVTQYWLTEGSDGWRLDVANEVSDETWQEFRQSVKALNSDNVIIGEIWDDAVEYLLGDMYDSVMNYVFRGAVTDFAKGGDAAASVRTLEKLRERYPKEAFYAMMNLVGSHDTARVLSYLDGIADDRSQTDIASAFPTYESTSELAKQRQYLVAFMQFTYAGAPTIYYGDEIGMVGADDPDDRRAFTWGKGNKELVTWYATLGTIRNSYSALRTGTVEVFDTQNANVISYVRRDDADTMIVLANNEQQDVQVSFSLNELNVAAESLTDLLSGDAVVIVDGIVTVTVPSLSGVILTEDVKEIQVNEAALVCTYDASYTVADKVLATQIALNKTAVSVQKNKTTTLTATITPSDVSDKTVIWTSSDETVAKVDAKGKITAVGVGTAVITAKAAFTSEDVTAKCTVTVTKNNTNNNGNHNGNNNGNNGNHGNNGNNGNNGNHNGNNNFGRRPGRYSTVFNQTPVAEPEEERNILENQVPLTDSIDENTDGAVSTDGVTIADEDVAKTAAAEKTSVLPIVLISLFGVIIIVGAGVALYLAKRKEEEAK